MISTTELYVPAANPSPSADDPRYTSVELHLGQTPFFMKLLFSSVDDILFSCNGIAQIGQANHSGVK
jgi:hypothetical protein